MITKRIPHTAYAGFTIGQGRGNGTCEFPMMSLAPKLHQNNMSCSTLKTASMLVRSRLRLYAVKTLGYFIHTYSPKTKLEPDRTQGDETTDKMHQENEDKLWNMFPSLLLKPLYVSTRKKRDGRQPCVKHLSFCCICRKSREIPGA